MHRPHKAEKSFIQATLINKNFLNNRKLKVKIRYTTNLISIKALCYEQNSPLAVSHTASGNPKQGYALLWLVLSILYYFSYTLKNRSCSINCFATALVLGLIFNFNSF